MKFTGNFNILFSDKIKWYNPLKTFIKRGTIICLTLFQFLNIEAQEKYKVSFSYCFHYGQHSEFGNPWINNSNFEVYNSKESVNISISGSDPLFNTNNIIGDERSFYTNSLPSQIKTTVIVNYSDGCTNTTSINNDISHDFTSDSESYIHEFLPGYNNSCNILYDVELEILLKVYPFFEIKPYKSISCDDKIRIELFNSSLYSGTISLEVRLKNTNLWEKLIGKDIISNILDINLGDLPNSTNWYNKELEFRVIQPDGSYSDPVGGFFFLDTPAITFSNPSLPTCAEEDDASVDMNFPSLPSDAKYKLSISRWEPDPENQGTGARRMFDINGVSTSCVFVDGFTSDDLTLEKDMGNSPENVPINNAFIKELYNGKNVSDEQQLKMTGGLYLFSVRTQTGSSGDLCNYDYYIYIAPPDSIAISNAEPKVLFTEGSTAYHIATPNGTGSATLTITGRNNTDYTLVNAPAGATLAKPTSGYTNYSVTGLGKGMHTLQVLNGTCYSNSQTVTLNAPNELLIEKTNTTDISCHNGTNGKIEFAISGGIGPFKVELLKNGTVFNTKVNHDRESTDTYFDGLSAGVYHLRVTDQADTVCSNATDILLSQPSAPVSLAGTVAKISWPGAEDGQVKLSASGGSGGYTYKKNNGAFSANPSFQNLAPGNYTFTVNDGNECPESVQVKLDDPSEITLAQTPSAATCKLNDGSLMIALNGGWADFTYEVILTQDGNTYTKEFPANVTPREVTFHGLEEGSYSLEAYVKGKSGNKVNLSGSIPMYNPLDGISYSLGDPESCAGNSDASLTLTNLDRIAGDYTFSGHSYFDRYTGVVSNLTSEAYSFTLSETMGRKCTKKVEVPLGAVKVYDKPLKLADLPYTATNAACPGAKNGELAIHAQNGFDPLEYKITQGGNSLTNGTGGFYGITNGTWKGTVTDAKGCHVEVDAVVEANANPVSPFTAVAGQHQSCTGVANGSILLTGLNHTNDGSLFLFLGNDAKGPITGPNHTISPLPSNTYLVIVKDADGCTQTQSVTVNNLNNRPAIVKDDIELLACPTASNGAVRITASAAYAPATSFTFAFSGDHPNKTETTGGDTNVKEYGRLGKNAYTVTVTDVVGCSSTITQTVALSPNPLTLKLNGEVVLASCQAANNGQVKLLAIGGKPSSGGGYTYSFPGLSNQSGNTAHFQGIGANNTPYTATVTDSEGCTAALAVPVGIIAKPFTINNVSIDPPLCHNDANATITIEADDWQNTSYSFRLERPDGTLAREGTTISKTIPDLPSGAYNLFMLSPDNCPGKYTDIVVPNPQPITVAIDSFKVLDKGLATGKVDVALMHGSGNYVYGFSATGSSHATIETSDKNLLFEGLLAGDYVFTLKDKNNCPYFGGSNPSLFTDTVTIDEPAERLAFVLHEHTDVQCFGYGNGIIRAGGTGGWSTDGTYQLRWGESGAWAGQINRRNLSPGTYRLFLKDDEGVVRDTTLTVAEPLKMSLYVSATKDASCDGGENGWIKASVLNGLPFHDGLNFRIDKGNNSQSLDNRHATGNYYFGHLPKGNYRLLVNDSHQCTDSAHFSIEAPETVTIKGRHNYIKAKGEPTGELNVEIAKGNGVYDYRWFKNGAAEPFESNRILEGSLALKDLTAGKYRLEVRDTANCFYEGHEWMAREFDIREPDQPLKLNAASIDSASCFGLSDGQVRLAPFGGWGNYSFRQNNGTFTVDSLFKNLGAGNYIFTVRDSAGVEFSLPVVLDQPEALSATVTQLSHLRCHMDGSGSIALNVTGGNGGYNVSTDNLLFVPGTTAGGLQAGSYAVYVNDRKGCGTNTPVQVIAQPDPVTNQSLLMTKSRCQNPDGAIEATFTGGTGNLSYKWSYNDAGVSIDDPTYYGKVLTFSTPSINGLYSGGYNLLVTDANNCPFPFVFRVDDLSDLSISHIAVDSVKCFGDANGSAVATVVAGNPPYVYSWNAKITDHDNQRAWALAAGSYDLMVTDSKKCRTSQQFFVPTPDPLSYGVNAIEQPLCFGGRQGSIDITAQGGSPSYSYLWNTGETTVGRTNLAPGTYSLTITDGHLCHATFDFPMDYQRSIKPYIGPDANICHYQTLSIDGGDFASFAWLSDNGFVASSRKVELTNPGRYLLEVRDADQCIGRDTMLLNVSYLRIGSTEKRDVTCHGFSDGSASVMVLPSDWPYQILWSNGSTASSVSGLQGGDYDVSVSDSYGCTDTRRLHIYEPEPLAVASWVKDPLCDGVPDGSVQVEASGGNQGYTYSWQPSYQGSKLAKLDKGTYTLTLADAKNCSLEKTFNLGYQRHLWPYLGNDATLCNGNSLKLYPGAFNGYQWFQNGTKTSADTAFVLNTPAEVAVRVNDADGCLASDTIKVSMVQSAFSPIFLSASSVAVGDTLLLVEVSNPKPVFVAWQISLPHQTVEESQYACKVVFEETGNAEIKLTAFNADCLGESWKHVLVVPRSEQPEGEDETVAFSKISSLAVSPNPSRGEFNASLELTDAMAAVLYLVNIGSGQIVETRQLAGSSSYHIPFSIQPIPGQYALFAECKGERRVVKIVVY